MRIPDNATFTFDLGTNMVNSAAGNNLFVPGIVSDLWFNSDTGGATGGDNSSLAQPAQRAQPPLPPICLGDDNITESPIQREYDFNIYLPKNPGQVFAEVGMSKPRAPLYVTISNPYGSPGPNPTFTRVTETVNGVTYEYIRVHLDLQGHAASTYSRRIEAAWVYPKADNWGLAQWRLSLNKLDIYDDLDSKLRWPGSDGDWILWMMLPGADQSWTRIRDGFNNTHGTLTFNPPWQTGSADPVFQHPPLELDPQRRLGPDILSFGGFVNFWMGGYEADEGDDDGSIAPMLQLLQVAHSNLFNLGFTHSNLFDQFFTDVDLELGTAFYIDCGATNEYTDALGAVGCPTRHSSPRPTRSSPSSRTFPPSPTHCSVITTCRTPCSTANAGSTATSATRSPCPTVGTPCCSTSPRTTRPA